MKHGTSIGDSHNTRQMMITTRKSNNRGFTLPEMLVVLCIMVGMSLIAIPAFMNLLPKMRLNSSSRQVYMAFARARQGAVTQNTNACVKFSQANRTVLAWLDNGPGAAAGNYAKDASEPYIFNGILDDGVSIALFYPYDTFTFNPRGMPNTSSWIEEQFLAYLIYLVNSEGRYKSIKISPTGGIKIS